MLQDDKNFNVDVLLKGENKGMYVQIVKSDVKSFSGEVGYIEGGQESEEVEVENFFLSTVKNKSLCT